jgi:hypothetical protein
MNCRKITSVSWAMSCAVLWGCPVWAVTGGSPQDATVAPTRVQEVSAIRSYTVDKKVSEFSPGQDLSTPEAAYATIMRDFMATGASDAEWSEISTWKSQKTDRTTVPPERASEYLNAHIQEVIIYKDRLAMVLAKMNEHGAVRYDPRMLFFHNGRWLNSGQDGLAPTIEEARYVFARKCEAAYQYNRKQLGEPVESRWKRPPVADPESYLKPYVEFLSEQGREPHAFMMEALKKYPLVVMGEIHNRPTYWAFNSELLRDPAFAQAVGTIYMELPSNHQGTIETFLASDTCRNELVVQMLRDFFELGWPCKPTLEFFIAVWEVNQKLPSDKKLRIRLVDMQRPWEKIQKREDWRAYDVDRDLFMAQNILADRRTCPDRRNGLFIVGMGHAKEGLRCSDQTTPYRSAGWHLRQSLGDQLFTVFQHAPVMTNRGATSGRLALGLIDSAFARLHDRPVAFTLLEGPFGKLPFDGMPDEEAYGTFADGYDAYLYLTPLEDEILSPLIEEFYSDKFMPEIDRRYRLMYGRPLFRDVPMPTPQRVTEMRAASWGQPRNWVSKLGPQDAWRYGDDWQAVITRQRHLGAMREELIGELDKIYRGIREIDPEKYSWEPMAKNSWGRSFDFDYLTMTDWPAMYNWWCGVIQEHPLEAVEYGELSRNKEGLPEIKVTTRLQGGAAFSKVFTFEYQAMRQRWQAQFGLDLHLDPQWKDFPETHKTPSP